MSTNDAATHQHALDELAAGDSRAAFRSLYPLLSDEQRAHDRAGFAATLRVFAEISAAIAGTALADTVRAAANDPDDLQKLYDLGYELIEQNLPEAAASVLTRANALAPGEEPLVTELVAALERSGRYGAACDVLRAEPALLDTSFMCRYLLACNAMMTGDVTTPRELLPRLVPDPTDDSQVVMDRRISRFVARYDALAGTTPLDNQDLRGWHAVLTGGTLLHLSPFGLDEGMNGRYAFVQDKNSRCVEAIRRVEAVLAAWGVEVPRVFALPDHDSQVLAHATAALLGVPLEPWPHSGSTAPGLLVAYDLGALEGHVLSSLCDHRPGQVLWSHAANWTQDQPLAADLVSFLYQFNHAPWGMHLAVDAETQQTREVPPDPRTPASIAEEVAAATLRDDALDDVATLVALARAAAAAPGDAVAAALRPDGVREQMWAGSPVPSSRFL